MFLFLKLQKISIRIYCAFAGRTRVGDQFLLKMTKLKKVRSGFIQEDYVSIFLLDMP